MLPGRLLKIDSPWSLRLGLICLVALSASLPIAWVSISKALLFTYGLIFLLSRSWTKVEKHSPNVLWTTRIILTLLAVFAISLVWTQADLENGLTAFVRHAKLMSTILLVTLIRSHHEARVAMIAYAGGQMFLLLSSWMMFLGIPIPWSVDAPTPYIVFSSYLDQSIMFATGAGIAWHLQNERIWATWAGVGFAVLALINVLLLLEGRSGYIIALTSLSLAAMWALPRRLRAATLVATPLMVAAGLLVGSDQVQERVTKIFAETTTYAKTHHVGERDSSAWRLNAWYRSAQAIQEEPLLGHGVGAWTPVVKRLQGNDAKRIFGEGNLSNPHQEYLLWGVELGIAGLLLLFGLVIGVGKDALGLPTNTRRATVSVAVAMAIACFFNSALFDDLLGDYFCVTLGLLLALGLHTKAKTGPSTATAALQTKETYQA
jgi:O-antigen ligase